MGRIALRHRHIYASIHGAGVEFGPVPAVARQLDAQAAVHGMALDISRKTFQAHAAIHGFELDTPANLRVGAPAVVPLPPECALPRNKYFVAHGPALAFVLLRSDSGNLPRRDIERDLRSERLRGGQVFRGDRKSVV